VFELQSHKDRTLDTLIGTNMWERLNISSSHVLVGITPSIHKACPMVINSTVKTKDARLAVGG
jgi:hypothetical protein